MNSLLTEYDEEKTLATNRKEAFEEGVETGIRKGVNVLIQDNIGEGKTREQIIDKLVILFSVSRDEAEQYYIQYTESK